MGVIKRSSYHKFYSFILIALLIVNIFAMLLPMRVQAEEGGITMSGSGLDNSQPITIVQKQLCDGDALPSEPREIRGETLPNEHDERYSIINTNLETKELGVPVTLEIYPTGAKIGDEIILNGDADPNTFVSIKVVDSEGNVVYYDSVKSGGDGKYNTTFIIPGDISGNLTVVAGYGINVSAKTLKIADSELADKGKLQLAINEALELDEKDYTEKSWTIFVVALTNAQDVLADKKATQNEIDEALAVLEVAINDLVETEGGGTIPDPNEDDDIVLEITGEGVANPKKYTLTQLEAMPQIQETYSCVNTWPTKQWYMGKGVALSYLLGSEQADIKPNATLIKFTSKDDYCMTLTVEELLEDRRYRFPNFKTGDDGDGHIPGSTKGEVKVETILALTSTQSDNPSYMNELDALHLMLGQRAVTEQIGPLFVKNVNKIEVLTGSIPKWDAPKAEPGSGTVPAGTEIRLENKNMDQDKIYYTTDGSTPTLDSPIYNWIAKRWWPARGDETVERINHPIVITEDTTIKAVTIGPGRRNSDIVTFTYKVTDAKPDIPDTSDKIKPSEGGTVSLGNDAIIEIPAGALSGTDDLEVKIERIKEPPTIPAGFKLLSDVFEFSIGGKQSYDFAKKVKIKLGFDPEILDQVEMPAVYYYDEVQSRWEKIEGTISDGTITVEIDHLTKFTIMALLKPGKLQFSDIVGHWAQDDIEKLVALGAINGYPDNSFKPDNNITRAEFTAVFMRSLELSLQNGNIFADTADHWACDIISTAAHHGIVNGYDDNTFGPDDPITREQMVAVIVRAIELVPETGKLDFIDNDRTSDWARGSMDIAVENGIINGYPDNTIRPQGLATRAEAVTVVVRALDKQEK